MRSLSPRFILISYTQRCPFNFSIYPLTPERLPRAKTMLLNYNAQSSSSNALLPPPWPILSPFVPLSSLLPFSPTSPGYTPLGRDPSRLLHLLNSIFRFQQSNLRKKFPPEHVSGSQLYILPPFYQLGL